MSGAKVFISYARPTLARARQAADALAAGGFAVWIDDQLLANRSFGDTIEQEIGAAQAVLVLWSADAVRSDWVRAEANRARETGKLVQARLDATPLPLPFDQIHCIDLAGWTGDRTAPAWRAVVDSIAASAGGTAPAPAGAALAPAKRRRRWPLAAGVAALAILGAAGVAVYREAPSAARAAAPPNSIAVLPFDNLSGDPGQAYFSDGMTEELRDALAGVGGLQVAARTSSNAFRGSNADVGTIAGKLGVAYVLDGSVRRSGKWVRISTQFIDARSGFEQWSHSYDRQLDDVIALQSEVARDVTAALKVKLRPGDTARLAQAGTKSPAALDAYLRGRQLFDRSGDEAVYRGALAQFDAAIAADPAYAAAHAARATTQATMASQFAVSVTDQSRQQAQALTSARRAVALAPDLAVAQSSLAYVLQQSLTDMAGVRAAYRRSLAAGGGGNANILVQFANFSVLTGDIPEGLAAATKAVGLDRYNPRAWGTLSQLLYYTRRYDEALARQKEALRLNPDYAFVHATAGNVLLLRGQFAAARAEFAAEPQEWARLTGIAVAEDKLGHRAVAAAALQQLIAATGETAIYQIALIYAQWGDRDAAFRALDRAFAVRDPGLLYLRQDPLLDPLRGDPRFRALLARWAAS